jgi:hypothetical protein
MRPDPMKAKPGNPDPNHPILILQTTSCMKFSAILVLFSLSHTATALIARNPAVPTFATKYMSSSIAKTAPSGHRHVGQRGQQSASARSQQQVRASQESSSPKESSASDAPLPERTEKKKLMSPGGGGYLGLKPAAGPIVDIGLNLCHKSFQKTLPDIVRRAVVSEGS